MRDKGWRIWKFESILKRRLKRHSERGHSYFSFWSDSLIRIKSPIWSDYISAAEVRKYKSMTTDKWDTRWKSKYSPNKTFYRDSGPNSREFDKKEFFKIKKEYGI